MVPGVASAEELVAVPDVELLLAPQVLERHGVHRFGMVPVVNRHFEDVGALERDAEDDLLQSSDFLERADAGVACLMHQLPGGRLAGGQVERTCDRHVGLLFDDTNNIILQYLYV